MGHDHKLGRECYQNHLIFYLNKQALTKLIHVKACGEEANIQILLHIKSLSCNYFSGAFRSDVFFLHNICVIHLSSLRNSPASFMHLLTHNLQSGLQSREQTVLFIVAIFTVSNRVSSFLCPHAGHNSRTTVTTIFRTISLHIPPHILLSLRNYISISFYFSLQTHNMLRFPTTELENPVIGLFHKSDMLALKMLTVDCVSIVQVTHCVVVSK
jgi:hypothetical protein